MLGASPMWAEYDVAFHLLTTASLYQVQSDWRHAAQMDDQAAPYYEDLVEHNPSVATFDQDLVEDFQGRVNAPEHENDRAQATAGSKDAVAFWIRQVDLHPDIPELRQLAADALKADAKVAQWLTQPASTQP